MALSSEDKYLVPGLVRGLQVLQAFTPESRRMSLSEIAQRLGMSRSAAFRAVYTLAELGYLLQDPGSKQYELGPSVLRLGYGFFASRELVQIAMPELERLRDATDWSAHLGVRDGRFVLYLLRVPSHMGLASIVHVGTRLPAAGTTMGRVLLADLTEAALLALYRDENYQHSSGRTPRSTVELVRQWRKDKETGTVTQLGSFESSIASVAAPIRDMSGSVVAAINATQIISPDMAKGIKPGVREEVVRTATAISTLLGGGGGTIQAR
jgi:DNA-binding IclR family transcriptional regulator